MTAWLAALRTAWGVVSSRPTIAVVCAVVGALVALELAGRGSVEVTPYTARATKRAAAAPVVVETLAVATLKPTAKVRERIAADYRQPGILAPADHFVGAHKMVGAPGDFQLFGDSERFASEILAEVRIEPLPAGGTALTTIDRATGQVETIVRPLPEPRISFANRWRLLGAYGQFEDREPIIRAQVEWWPVKIRRIELGAAAGWERTDRGRAYLLAQVAVVPR